MPSTAAVVAVVGDAEEKPRREFWSQSPMPGRRESTSCCGDDAAGAAARARAGDGGCGEDD